MGYDCVVILGLQEHSAVRLCFRYQDACPGHERQPLGSASILVMTRSSWCLLRVKGVRRRSTWQISKYNLRDTYYIGKHQRTTIQKDSSTAQYNAFSPLASVWRYSSPQIDLVYGMATHLAYPGGNQLLPQRLMNRGLLLVYELITQEVLHSLWEWAWRCVCQICLSLFLSYSDDSCSHSLSRSLKSNCTMFF